ncbi:bifunctional folylpolyglutamate synthase/dihydrofolate synthase [Lentilactobacillus fungorum]|uniref:tetrahydrofolate synthase n=1 Tax=Lentilactobacillus fungorum TaxID=2201250 RepID=A0ABQ3VW82_9LACO|nr:folylpolyglutamate synthase/dihydrofolate synthase family protein [Lentilactobacillus fungorum]GHP12599.1 bifunctional folylpolyglutamate synthase/dihydrofolate synthase [Lentilactobacillus fungorum]
MINSYEEALNFIHGRSQFKKIPTLKRMRRFLDELGAPDKQVNAIHVAGTNGKGSTVAFLRNILQQDGNTVGTFTSPFLIKFNERISVNGVPISDKEVLRLTQKLYPVVKKLDQLLPEGGPTEFEIVTAMMFTYFAEGHADVVIIEVGLGGLFDSTNVIVPKVSVIVTIGWDHMHILGNTLPKIAYQKAGIIKPGVPVVVGRIDSEPLEVIKRVAEEKQSLISILNRDFRATSTGENNWQQQFNFAVKSHQINGLTTHLLGDYQVDNAAVAIAAYRMYCQRLGKPVNLQSIRNGVKATQWAGRFERLSIKPTIVLDGAHNISAVDELVELLRTDFSDRRLFILMGILADKQADKMVTKMATLPNTEIVLTHFAGPNKRQAADPEKLEHQVGQTADPILTITDWHQAINTLKDKLTGNDMLLITGSLYFISDARKYLLSNFK